MIQPTPETVSKQSLFAKLNATSIDEYSAAIKRSKDPDPRLVEIASESDRQFNILQQLTGKNADQYQKELLKSENELDAHLRKARPQLLDRKINADRATHTSTMVRDTQAINKYKTAVPSNATIFSPDTAMLQSLQGERSNIWVSPTNPGQIELKDTARGSGTGWGAVAYPPAPAADVYFYFTPDTTAMWNLSAAIAFDGFYIVRADDGFFTHKYAEVRFSANMKVYQYSWQGEKNFMVLHIDESNINNYSFVETTEFLNTTALLKKGDPVLVKVRMTVAARASGSGSYAELNFLDGAANHIIPALLIANPV